jgi:hypothetical protein
MQFKTRPSRLLIRGDVFDCENGGETPPKPAGEDACGTIASAKIFDVVYDREPHFAD